MPSTRELARRNLVKILGQGALVGMLLGYPVIYFSQKMEETKIEKVVSDPEIAKTYSDLMKKLKAGQITEYDHKETFDPYLEAWLEFMNYMESDEFRKGNYAKGLEIQEKRDSLFDRYEKSVLKPDTFSDVDNLERFIQDNSVSFDDVVDEMNKRKVILFGESHLTESHDRLELRLVRCINSKDLVCMHEFLQIDMADLIKKYLDGEECFEKLFDGFNLGGRKYLEDFMKEIKKKKIPLVPADAIRIIEREFEDKKIGPLYDPRAIYIRDQLFTGQVSYAVNKGYRVFGIFGDFHLRPNHLPSYLGKKGINPLVISGTGYTTEVYDAAMKVSGESEIFFWRNNRIIYVTPQKRNSLKSKKVWDK